MTITKFNEETCKCLVDNYSKGLTIRQVAHSCNMASQSLTSAINGNIPFYQGWKRRVADALGESVEDLFSEGKQR